ncbi:MAG: hypothetical protein GWP91_04495 [Rhodobacterales bacterium]|nr:hypothetical protein [Rhodobacterales bacterium]
MDATWSAPGITGVFIRLRWNQVQTGPGQYDWSILDREVQRAVDAGKQYSIGVKAGKKGTPDWIFTSGGVERLRFQDWGSSATLDCKKKPCCGYHLDLGSPSDDEYRKQYFGMLDALGSHLQEDASWFRALAMVKPSGMNFLTHENRLPKRCEPGCLCNTEVWAKADNPYTPEALTSFYEAQFNVIEKAFPGKTISYMLIQAGFPLVRDENNYLGGGTHNLPKGTSQTEDIIAMGHAQHTALFAVQHNGLGPGPRNANPADSPCAKGKKPLDSDEHCPSPWVLRNGKRGMVTGFQTVNGARCGDSPTLDRTLLNLEENSNGVFIEVYEQRTWEATAQGGALDSKGSKRSLEAWNTMLHHRAGTSNTYEFTFDGSDKEVSFVSAARCSDEPSVGTIKVR